MATRGTSRLRSSNTTTAKERAASKAVSPPITNQGNHRSISAMSILRHGFRGQEASALCLWHKLVDSFNNGKIVETKESLFYDNRMINGGEDVKASLNEGFTVMTTTP